MKFKDDATSMYDIQTDLDVKYLLEKPNLNTPTFYWGVELVAASTNNRK